MGHANYSGLVIAALGFFLTRFTVTLAIYDDPVRFYLAGVVPLVLGLGLAAFGVALTVADVEPRLVRTTAVWCVLGTAGMLVLVVLTLLGSTIGMSDVGTIRSQTYLSTFLIGGSVGGTLTGLYASRTRRHRDVLRQQTNRLVVLNRMLRHEILNALTPIRGYGTAEENDRAETAEVIADRTDDIEATIQEVSFLTKHAGEGQSVGTPVDLDACLADSVATVEDRHPDVTVAWDGETDARVSANERVEQVFTQLLENAVIHGDDDSPALAVDATRETVRVSVTDDGPGLPESQQRLLETGDIEEFDDPRMGYGLNVVRLLVESYGGTVETDRSGGETTVTVVLSRARERDGDRLGQRTLRPGVPNLVLVLLASLVAGVAYGLVSEAFGGSIAGIGVFYGVATPVVGWLTHQFHSVVFGFVFAGLLSLVPRMARDSVLASVGVAVGWAMVLWLGAAGLVAPVWLRLLGIEAPLPNVTAQFFVTHLVWGLSLGLLTAWGEQSLLPRIADLRDGE